MGDCGGVSGSIEVSRHLTRVKKALFRVAAMQ
jgi:hypothetical protein